MSGLRAGSQGTGLRSGSQGTGVAGSSPSWIGSAATVDASALSGSFASEIVWTGSSSTVEASALSGSFITPPTPDQSIVDTLPDLDVALILSLDDQWTVEVVVVPAQLVSDTLADLDVALLIPLAEEWTIRVSGSPDDIFLDFTETPPTILPADIGTLIEEWTQA